MDNNVAKYFLVKVEFETINESKYLVDAMTCTEAEARTRAYLKESVMDYEIVSTTKSPIEDVIEVKS